MDGGLRQSAFLSVYWGVVWVGVRANALRTVHVWIIRCEVWKYSRIKPKWNLTTSGVSHQYLAQMVHSDGRTFPQQFPRTVCRNYMLKLTQFHFEFIPKLIWSLIIVFTDVHPLSTVSQVRISHSPACCCLRFACIEAHMGKRQRSGWARGCQCLRCLHFNCWRFHVDYLLQKTGPHLTGKNAHFEGHKPSSLSKVCVLWGHFEGQGSHWQLRDVGHLLTFFHLIVRLTTSVRPSEGLNGSLFV